MIVTSLKSEKALKYMLHGHISYVSVEDAVNSAQI